MISTAVPYQKKSSTTSPVPRSPAKPPKKTFGMRGETGGSPQRQSAPAVPTTPDLPAQLTEEFKKLPTNYDMIDALGNEDYLQANQKKWRELGILYAEDIVRNAKTPIDYHLRVSENDIRSGFG